MKNNGFILNQGYKYIITFFVIAIVLSIFGIEFFSTIFYLITLLTIFIFRNQERLIFKNKNSILSPIDGKITAIDIVNGKRKIYCKVTPCNTHVVRAPSDTNIKIKNQKNGINLNPNSYKATILNEQITFKLSNMKLKLISGICNTKIEYTENTTAEQGEPIAIFIDGLAIITLKENINIDLKIGDKLTAGQSILFTK